MADTKNTDAASAEARKIAEKSQENQAAKSKVAAESPEENVKVSTPPGTVPSSMQAAGPSPKHPSVDAPTPTSDPELKAARDRAQADTEYDLEDEEDDLDTPSNIGAPIGKPIACVVKKKFYSEEGQVIVPGKTYYLQLHEGQTFPSNVLEPVDKKVSSKFRREFKKRKQERAEARILRERARDQLVYGGLAPAGRARTAETPSK